MKIQKTPQSKMKRTFSPHLKRIVTWFSPIVLFGFLLFCHDVRQKSKHRNKKQEIESKVQVSSPLVEVNETSVVEVQNNIVKPDSRKPKRPILRWIPLVLFVAVAFFTHQLVGVYAWLSSEGVAQNVVHIPKVTVEVNERNYEGDPDGWQDPGIVWGSSQGKIVQFTNTGTVPVLIRAAVAQSWIRESDGTQEYLSNVWLGQSVASLVYGPEGFNKDEFWYPSADGWKYYRYVLQPGETTGNVLVSVDFDETATEVYQGANYQLEFRLESVQYSLQEQNQNVEAAQAMFGRGFTLDSTTGQLTWSVTGG